MEYTFKELQMILWKALMATYAASHNKWRIANGRREELQREMAISDPDSAYYRSCHMMKSRWGGVARRCLGLAQYSSKAGLTAHKHLWTSSGFDEEELPDIDDFRDIMVDRTTAFNEHPPAEVVVLEKQFKRNDQEISTPTDPWVLQLEKIMDSFIDDVHKAIGVALWANSEFQKIKDTIEVDNLEYVLDGWEVIIEASYNGFYFCRNCMIEEDIANAMALQGRVSGDRMASFEFKTRSKFNKGKPDAIVPVGGIFIIERDKLPAEWQQKIVKVADVHPGGIEV